MIENTTPSIKRTTLLQVRLTTPEFEHIKGKARERGFESISDFFRHMVFWYDVIIEGKISETNKTVKEIHEIIKTKNKAK